MGALGSAWIERRGDRYVATNLTAPVVCAAGETREEAVAGLAQAVAAYRGGGELVSVEWPTPNESGPPTIVPPSSWPPSPEDEEYHREFIAEIYRQRDEEKRREFGE